MSEPIRVLIVEDSEDDAKLMARELEMGGFECVTTRVETAPAMESALAGQSWDLILSDFTLPMFNGLDALGILQKSGIDIPFILVSGTIGEWVAVSAVKAGAHDYIMKNNLRRLSGAAVREIREAKIRADARRLEAAERERLVLEIQLRQAHKLESIGQIAAGIAHEINTPMQFVGDNLRFAQKAFDGLTRALSLQRRALADLPAPAGPYAVEAARLAQELDLEFLLSEIPSSLTHALEGVEKVSRIAGAMREFSHPGSGSKTPVDINRAIETTILISKSVWKYVATMETDLAEDLPHVPGLAGELDQVFLNLIINAAHAVEEAPRKSEGLGTIRIRTRGENDSVEVRIADSGVGIPAEARSRIFEPFFTTKPVGKGTGQGLALARSVVVEKHGGTLAFDTEVGRGTEFIVRLPLGACAA